MAPVGRVVPSAATAGLETADPFAGRDVGSTTASRFEVRLQGAIGEPIKSREPELDPDSGTSLCDLGQVTLPENCSVLICKMVPTSLGWFGTW